VSEVHEELFEYSNSDLDGNNCVGSELEVTIEIVKMCVAGKISVTVPHLLDTGKKKRQVMF
jgi:hypothetical protein